VIAEEGGAEEAAAAGVDGVAEEAEVAEGEIGEVLDGEELVEAIRILEGGAL
jgi:hypothetical protein